MANTEKRDLKNICTRLWYLRCKKGISRREVARLANIDHTRYGALEREGISCQIRTLILISNKAYNISLEKFFTFKLPKKMPEDPITQGTHKRKKRKKVKAR